MSIKANLLRDSQGNITVQMQGDFDYENGIPLRNELSKLIDDHPESKLNIDMSGIDFVGSAGISIFAETLKILHGRIREKISLSNVAIDFQRVFKLYGVNETMIEVKNLDDSMNTIQTSQRNRRVFEN
jgi:anti-anti-sigma factor